MKKVVKSNFDIKEVCYECGVTANVLTCLKKYGRRPNKIHFNVSTYHNGICDICDEERPVTEPRDFYYPDFSLLDRRIIYIAHQDDEPSDLKGIDRS